jgi:hypothetical protein
LTVFTVYLLASAPCSLLTSGSGKCFRRSTSPCSYILQCSFGVFWQTPPFSSSFSQREEVLCSNPGGLQLLQNQPVDVSHRNEAHFWHLLLDVASSGTGVFLNKSFKDLEGIALYLLWPSRALFPPKNLQGAGSSLPCSEAKDGELVVAKAVGKDVHRDSLLLPG